MAERPQISTHVLDTEHGTPAEGVTVRLYSASGELVGEGTTDSDGRISDLLAGDLLVGDYRIEFALDSAFFRHAALTFRVDDPSRGYHVPLLLAPYSLASYRGS